MPQVFISYSRKDLTFIERLAADLKDSGFEVWYDLSKLEGGARWNRVIEQAIEDSQYVVVVLSPDSVASEWVDDEVGYAKRLKKKVIPLHYLQCKIGLVYGNLNYIDVQGRKYIDNFNQILRALNAPAVGRVSNPTPSVKPEQSQAKSLTYEMPAQKPIEQKKPAVETPKPVHAAQSPTLAPHASAGVTSLPIADTLTLSNGMKFMRIPAGKFLMGSKGDNKLAYDDEEPQHTVDIPYDYWMAHYPVTNELYYEYVKSKGIKHPVEGWEKKKDHPVVLVSWKDAMAYCQWLNQILNSEIELRNLQLRLPTEAEWEKAARGRKGWEYPWGNTFDINKCNTDEGGKCGTVSVGLYSPQGDSPYGCADMSGNVWEWTHSLYKPYFYHANDGRENEKNSDVRVLRGGSFIDYERNARCACRLRDVYLNYDSRAGFRVVASPVHF